MSKYGWTYFHPGECESSWGFCHCNREWLGVNCEAKVGGRAVGGHAGRDVGRSVLVDGDRGRRHDSPTRDADGIAERERSHNRLVEACDAEQGLRGRDGIQFAGSVLDMKPDGQTFLVPLTLEFAVSAAAAGQSGSFGVYLFDRTVNQWTLLPSSVHDTATGKVGDLASFLERFEPRCQGVPRGEGRI
eukprot:3937426-Rhodomonas_salina.1